MKAPPILTPALPTIKLTNAFLKRFDGQGASLLPVAKPIERARLIAYRRDGTSIRANVDDGGTIRALRIKHVDHPALMCLSDCDRATLQGALTTIHRGAINEP